MGGSDSGIQNFGGRTTGSAGGQTGSPDDDCASYREKSMLASPDPNVLATLKSGQRLRVEPTNRTTPVQAITEDGQVAGTLMPSSLDKLLSCINSGTLFEAIVDSVNGGACTVLITARK